MTLLEKNQIKTYGSDDITNESSVAGITVSDALENAASKHSWLPTVKDQVDFTTAEPAGPTTGDRYINTVTGTSSITTQAVTATYIYQWNGASWTETIPQENDAVWDLAANAAFVYNSGAWVLLDLNIDQTNVFYVDDNGDDNASGTSPLDMLATEGEAIKRINALTGGDVPGVSNPWRIERPGAAEITTDFAIPNYVAMQMRATLINANVSGGNFSVLNCKSIRGQVASGYAITKRAGADDFTVYYSDFTTINTDFAINLGTAAQGRLIINGPGGLPPGSVSGGPSFITDSSTGPIDLNFFPYGFKTSTDGTATNELFIFGGSADFNINGNIDDNFGAGTTVKVVSGTPKIYFNNNSMTSSGREFWNISGTPDIRFLTQDFNDFGGTVANYDVNSFDSSVISNYKNFFADLSTTPVNVGTLVTGTQYLIRIKTPAINSGHLTLGIEHNGATYDFTTVAQLQSNAVNIGLTGAPGSYGITIGGYATLFALNINTTTGATTFATQSGTATGQTELQIIKLTP